MYPNFPYQKQEHIHAYFEVLMDYCYQSTLQDCRLGTFSISRKKIIVKNNESNVIKSFHVL